CLSFCSAAPAARIPRRGPETPLKSLFLTQQQRRTNFTRHLSLLACRTQISEAQSLTKAAYRWSHLQLLPL
ncbi:mCG1039150, partial [Mus musculus]